MKRTDINDNFVTKDRKSSKGTKKNFLNEHDGLDRKRKLHFKNYVKNSQFEDDIDDYDLQE